ncbi:MAG: class I SAM-dependent methyltransferase [Proteobacteria bacterium]|nr:class I SAM-dependent methyltransferase [Pseudomonadota bacterium]MBU4296672.1 class I SAM-dependent methyltransferase [Pseudomonadota bacterium]MCG2748465.1 class I SAM-dependent methyltransferase [Desulfobulbaceae bacterium]
MTLTTQRVIDFGEKVWRLMHPYTPEVIIRFFGLLVTRILFCVADRKIEQVRRELGCPCLPPAHLRYRVWGDPDINTFVWSGKHVALDIVHALEKNGRSLSDFRNILDFGCGCGRIEMFLAQLLHADAHYQGVDNDKETITWCRENMASSYAVNDRQPPLSGADGQYDLIIAIAVFRHLSVADQKSWLAEFKRLLAPGGICLISLHGHFCWKDFSAEDQLCLQEKGFLMKEIVDPYQRSVFPAWYRAAYHSRAFATELYGNFFEIMDYIEQGVENETDLLVLKQDEE